MTRLSMIFCFVAFVATSADAELWGTLTSGPYAPGFEVIHTQDVLRSSDDGTTRPVQISVWYPAKAEPLTDRMDFGDYVRLSARETAGDSDNITVEEFQEAQSHLDQFPTAGLAEATVDNLISLPTRAILGANKASGTFPLLVMIQGNHDPAYRHFILAEYLASHGYVVAAVPSASRYVRDQMDMNFGHGPFVDQIRDTTLVVDYMRGQYDLVDSEKFMLFGFSMGGNTGGYNLLRDPDAMGFACLDCGLGSTWGTPDLNQFRDTLFANSVGRQLAILHLSKGDDRDDDSFIDSFHNATAYHATVKGAKHFNFTSLGAMAAEVPALENPDWLIGGKIAREIHDQVVEITRHFLDAHFKNRADALQKLQQYDPASGSFVRMIRIAHPGQETEKDSD